MSHYTRRRLLRHVAAATAWASTGGVLGLRTAFAANGSTASRLVLVQLRGALDGLAAVAPVGDPDYARLRAALALPPQDEGVLALDGLFALHPALAFLADCWRERQLTVVHAVATPYRERSHFEGQDVLESGFARPRATQTGWLNRALSAVPSAPSREAGMALGTTLPLVMRGPAPVASWSPSMLAALDDDTLQRLGDLYAGDDLLARRLAQALAADQTAGAMRDEAAAPGTARRDAASRYLETVKAAAGFLRTEQGPRVAVLDTTGWDTHANEGAAQGQLAQRLRVLDQGLRALRDGLGDTWQHTAVLVVTEFGRTAAVNGTGGTDHGTGTVAFVLGGAVQGGRVLADWPGLAAANLYEGRDLKPTTDLRSVCKTVLRDHLGVAPRHIDSAVFPDSRAAGYLQGLVRA